VTNYQLRYQYFGASVTVKILINCSHNTIPHTAPVQLPVRRASFPLYDTHVLSSSSFSGLFKSSKYPA
jgi:hypothetical protein